METSSEIFEKLEKEILEKLEEFPKSKGSEKTEDILGNVVYTSEIVKKQEAPTDISSNVKKVTSSQKTEAIILDKTIGDVTPDQKVLPQLDILGSNSNTMDEKVESKVEESFEKKSQIIESIKEELNKIVQQTIADTALGKLKKPFNFRIEADVPELLKEDDLEIILEVKDSKADKINKEDQETSSLVVLDVPQYEQQSYNENKKLEVKNEEDTFQLSKSGQDAQQEIMGILKQTFNNLQASPFTSNNIKSKIAQQIQMALESNNKMNSSKNDSCLINPLLTDTGLKYIRSEVGTKHIPIDISHVATDFTNFLNSPYNSSIVSEIVNTNIYNQQPKLLAASSDSNENSRGNKKSDKLISKILRKSRIVPNEPIKMSKTSTPLKDGAVWINGRKSLRNQFLEITPLCIEKIKKGESDEKEEESETLETHKHNIGVMPQPKTLIKRKNTADTDLFDDLEPEDHRLNISRPYETLSQKLFKVLKSLVQLQKSEKTTNNKKKKSGTVPVNSITKLRNMLLKKYVKSKDFEKQNKAAKQMKIVLDSIICLLNDINEQSTLQKSKEKNNKINFTEVKEDPFNLEAENIDLSSVLKSNEAENTKLDTLKPTTNHQQKFLKNETYDLPRQLEFPVKHNEKTEPVDVKDTNDELLPWETDEMDQKIKSDADWKVSSEAEALKPLVKEDPDILVKENDLKSEENKGPATFYEEIYDPRYCQAIDSLKSKSKEINSSSKTSNYWKVLPHPDSTHDSPITKKPRRILMNNIQVVKRNIATNEAPWIYGFDDLPDITTNMELILYLRSQLDDPKFRRKLFKTKNKRRSVAYLIHMFKNISNYLH